VATGPGLSVPSNPEEDQSSLIVLELLLSLCELLVLKLRLLPLSDQLPLPLLELLLFELGVLAVVAVETELKLCELSLMLPGPLELLVLPLLAELSLRLLRVLWLELTVLSVSDVLTLLAVTAELAEVLVLSE